MDCNDAREGLWPPERPRLMGEDVALAHRHVDECPGCREFFTQDRALIELYERARREKAPLAVRERVFDALARARWDARSPGRHNARRTRVRYLVLAGGGILAAAAIALGLRLQISTSSASNADESTKFVEDYLRRAVGQDHIETSDPEEVGRFLTRELGIPLRPLAAPGLELQGAEICLLEGRRGAMIVYKKEGTSVSHYLVPREGAGKRAPAFSASGPGEPVTAPAVITWSTPSLEQALVGDLGSETLLRLARAGYSLD